jgi:hypothetical protein
MHSQPTDDRVKKKELVLVDMNKLGKSIFKLFQVDAVLSCCHSSRIPHKFRIIFWTDNFQKSDLNGNARISTCGSRNKPNSDQTFDKEFFISSSSSPMSNHSTSTRYHLRRKSGDSSIQSILAGRFGEFDVSLNHTQPSNGPPAEDSILQEVFDPFSEKPINGKRRRRSESQASSLNSIVERSSSIHHSKTAVHQPTQSSNHSGASSSLNNQQHSITSSSFSSHIDSNFDTSDPFAFDMHVSSESFSSSSSSSIPPSSSSSSSASSSSLRRRPRVSTSPAPPSPSHVQSSTPKEFLSGEVDGIEQKLEAETESDTGHDHFLSDFKNFSIFCADLNLRILWRFSYLQSPFLQPAHILLMALAL